MKTRAKLTRSIAVLSVCIASVVTCDIANSPRFGASVVVAFLHGTDTPVAVRSEDEKWYRAVSFPYEHFSKRVEMEIFLGWTHGEALLRRIGVGPGEYWRSTFRVQRVGEVVTVLPYDLIRFTTSTLIDRESGQMDGLVEIATELIGVNTEKLPVE